MTSPQHRLSTVGHLRTAVLAALLLTAPLFGTTAAAQAATQPGQATAPNATAAVAQWTGWAEVPGGGATPDSPAAVSYNGAQNVFVRGTDNAIYRNILNAGAWSGWTQVPGNGATPSAPAAVAFGGALHLFVRGTDNAIYRNILNAGAWSGWTQVPGNGATMSALGADTFSGTLQLFARGTDNRIYRNVLVP